MRARLSDPVWEPQPPPPEPAPEPAEGEEPAEPTPAPEPAPVEERMDAYAAALAGLEEAAAEAGVSVVKVPVGGTLPAAWQALRAAVDPFHRSAVAAVAFSDPSHLTCIANDFGYEEVFAREVEAYGKTGDLLVAISTSGNSPNVLRACEVARERGVKIVGLLGKGGGPMLEKVDIPIVVPNATTSDRIQEVHIKVLHIAIEAVERRMFPENYR